MTEQPSTVNVPPGATVLIITATAEAEVTKAADITNKE